MQPPTSIPLPGTEGTVWRTPRNSSPEFEFGDGVSAVFKSLSVSSPDPAPASRHVLSANTAPFVPSLQQPPQPHPAIPIPLPSMGNGQQAHSIHINNFTANLNYPAAVAMPTGNIDRESPVVTTQYMPHYPAHYMPSPGQFEASPGHYPSYAGPLVLFPQAAQIPIHHPAYHPNLAHAQQPQVPMTRDDQQNFNNGGGAAGITFGSSTPVVSIRTGPRTSETEDSFNSEQNQFQSKFPQPPVVKQQEYGPPVVKQAEFQPPPAKIQERSAQMNNQEYHPPGFQNDTKVIQSPVYRDDGVHPRTPGEQAAFAHAKPAFRPQVQARPQEMDQVSVKNEIPSERINDPGQYQPNQSSNNLNKIQPKQSVNNEVNVNNHDSVKPEVPPVQHHQQLQQHHGQEQEKPAVEDAGNSGAPSGTWASLFASKAAASSNDTPSPKPMARIQPFSTSEATQTQEDKPQLNSADVELGTFLKAYSLKHVAAALLPRGLLNRSNWCFVNAILQALLACPPFYNMMKNLAATINPLKQNKSKTPMLDSIVEFVSEFSVLDTAQINKPQKKDKNRKKDDIVTGISLEPMYVYNMLLNLEDETFKVVDGRQEDAEEFLSCLLNGLSDEMSNKMKLVVEEASAEANEGDENDEDVDDDWKEVGAKGRSCVTRRVADSCQLTTPIQALALGMCRSCVKSETGDNSATLQPFYTLQLDIQEDDVKSVGDALVKNFANEKLDGFVCSKTKKEIDATRSLSIEELPPILILHLKRFVYDANTGGVQKILKQIEFSVDLEVSKSILSAECRASNKQRQYKLFSVVYHNGREATKGHYVTDIFHTGYSSWLHCDDSQVSATCEQSVLAPSPTSTPYILLYRRGDTIVGMDKKSQS